jgi:hypothetical protein
MNNSEHTHDRATTTEQIAAAGTADSRAAGTADSRHGTSPGQHPPGDTQAEQPASATQAAAGGDLGVGDQPPAQLLADDELHSIQARWKDRPVLLAAAIAVSHLHIPQLWCERPVLARLHS